jgi:hypothetical protein
VHALWAGLISQSEFIDSMNAAIGRGLSYSWQDAGNILGISSDDYTQEEINARDQFILEQSQYVDGFAQFVAANSKAAGRPFSAVIPRMNMWVNAWNTMHGKAMLMMGKNQKMEWVLGPTEEHCEDCSKYDGRVYRASVWAAYGIETQSHKLSCHGYNCKCALVATQNPCTPGKPPRMTGGA